MPVVAEENATASALERVDRQWWPSEYLDESVPAGQATPDGWLCQLNDGAHAYGIPGSPHAIYAPRGLAEGEVVLFHWQEDAGTATLTIEADGTFRCEPQPAYDTFLYLKEDSDICGDSLRQIVEQLVEQGEPEGEHVLEVTRISLNCIPHRFTAADGRPRFEPVEGVAPVEGSH